MQYPKAASPKEVTEELKKKLSERLKELNELATADDRAEYMNEKSISQGNLSLYMNGTIYNIDKAIDMVEFFQTKIDGRNKKVQELLGNK